MIPNGSTRAPWGWTAIIAPVAMLRFLLNVTGIPLTDKLAVEKRGEVYRECQRLRAVVSEDFQQRIGKTR
jgi:steroid 5-alpha reductase family enzyme